MRKKAGVSIDDKVEAYFTFENPNSSGMISASLKTYWQDIANGIKIPLNNSSLLQSHVPVIEEVEYKSQYEEGESVKLSLTEPQVLFNDESLNAKLGSKRDWL